MPCTPFMWAVSSGGRIYLLSTKSERWDELENCRAVDFKRVSCVEHCAWALGGDNQIYLYVIASEVPIRYKEISYENQRWNPNSGFSNSLLPTDRPQFSSQDGLVDRHKDKIQLPSSSWIWENDWTIDDSLDGQPLGQEGWMYAFDFPSTYGKDKKLTSFVRRRKWFRYRRFAAVNKWILISGINDDPCVEPFIDIAIGGLDIPGGDSSTLTVWAVTVQGRVMFRQGVTREKPEGNGWAHVPIPTSQEVSNISVGPTGLVWVITWDGQALARIGVTRQKVTGNDWAKIDPPLKDGCSFLQVSVGTNVVWAIGRDSQVWFRKGIRGNESGLNDQCAIGTGWVEMIGCMSVVAVGPDDQVWAISKNEPNVIFFRTGITATDTSGKTWKPIMLPVIQQHYDINNSSLIQQMQTAAVSESEGDNSDSGICTEAQTHTVRSIGSSGDHAEIDNAMKMKSLEGVSGTSSETSSPCLQRATSSLQESLAGTDDEYFVDSDLSFAWIWISVGACRVDPLHLPDWFCSSIITKAYSISKPWRKGLDDKLFKRRKREIESFESFQYEQAIDKVSWKKTGQCQIWSGSQWNDSNIELEQINTDSGNEGIISLFKPLTEIDLCEIACLVCGSDQSKSSLTIYKTRKENSANVCTKIAFSSDTDLEDWAAVLSNACCEMRNITGKPSPEAIWSTTCRGDIFSHNPTLGLSFTPRLSEMFWCQTGGHLKCIEACSAGVVWGIGYNHIPVVYTGGWGGGFFKGLSSSSFGIHSVTDTRNMYIYENQRWNPLTGFSSRGLPTDRYMWSDSTGRHECTKENTKLPSMHWQWVMDWTVDYHAPGGVDREGWQYARDFPRTYHARKGITDYVRRRRWYRKCKLSTTGPWEVLDSVPLLDVSFQTDHSDEDDEPIDTWAVDHHGNILYRHGVTIRSPMGVRWEHVAGDDFFCSVSVGGKRRVWAVSRDGSAFFRNGITANNRTGVGWFHVEPPSTGVSLQQVSAGTSCVWAVDKNGGLWFRQEIMVMFPEGTSWKFIDDEVHKVSVGINDEVWVIAKVVNTSAGPAFGVMCRRRNISKANEMGAGWDYAIGCGWNHVSIRGCKEYTRPDPT